MAQRDKRVVAWVAIEDKTSGTSNSIKVLIYSYRGTDRLLCPVTGLKVPQEVYANYALSGANNLSIRVTKWIQLPHERPIIDALINYERSVTPSTRFEIGVVLMKDGQNEQHILANSKPFFLYQILFFLDSLPC